MKIGIVSDLHLDFYVPTGKQNKLQSHIDRIITAPIDVLIIAGDISHYNSQIMDFCKIVNSKGIKVVAVVGNHDHYAVSKEQFNKYPKFLDRFNDLKQRFTELTDSYLLDGDIVTIDGVTFGGACGWYDGTLSLTAGYSNFSELRLWQSSFNDYRKIPGLNDYLDMFQIENPKVLNVYDKCDIMITHPCPISSNKFVAYEYQYDRLNGFYSFNGQHLVESSSAKYWIYGHMHTPDDRQLTKQNGEPIRLIRNPYGYPGFEEVNYEFKVIEI